MAATTGPSGGTAAALSDPSGGKGERTAFRINRAKRQNGFAALVLVGGYAAIIVFNLFAEAEATLWDFVPNLMSIAVLLAGAWLYRRASTPVALLPWIAAVVSLVLVELLLLESWRDQDNPAVEYALIIMVVFSQFVLAVTPAFVVAVPMLISYVAVSTDAGVADLGDASIIGLTALAVGMFSLGLRIRLADSLAAALDRAEVLATYDELTGVLNRRGLAEAAPLLIAVTAPRDGTLAVAFLDIDGMKLLNDIHGHESGDEVVRIVAGALRSTSRRSDLTARWGGDEFVVIAAGEPTLDGEEWVERLAGSVRHAAAGHPYWNGTVTVGFAIGPAGNGDWLAPVDSADLDMYARKQGDRTHENAAPGGPSAAFSQSDLSADRPSIRPSWSPRRWRRSRRSSLAGHPRRQRRRCPWCRRHRRASWPG